MNPNTDWWHAERVHVTVHGVLGSRVSYVALDGGASQWLGTPVGLVIHLKRTDHQADESA
ncbi:hypothetical protein [Nonomuraea sp. NPDC050643]|uniref:hypothetical protein n=1 Tax=Nonomuraea sp. NPDC050643 TaxID=3155660 RepID=UPI0033C4CDA2